MEKDEHPVMEKDEGAAAASFRIANEFAAVDVACREVAWGAALEIVDARTGLSIQLDALEVEALTSLSASDREALVNRSAGPLTRMYAHSPKEQT